MIPSWRKPAVAGVIVARRERVFLDANVLFSAAIGSAVCRSITGLPSIRVLTSDYCLAEAERNLVAKGYDVLTALAELVDRIDVVATPPQAYWQALSPLLPTGAVTDLPVLGAARAAKADVLVTGNTRDFGQLMDHGLVDGPEVLTPRAFLERGPRPA